MKKCAFTIDLERDYAGCVDGDEIFKDPAEIEILLSTLTSLDVRITAFAVADLFASFPNIINLFEKYNCEFEVHSYSHDLNRPDSEEEIEQSRKAYFDYFGRYPRGYRAPRGNITSSGITFLEKHGFLYDASVIPAYFPNPLRTILSRKEIHYVEGSSILEIPVTAVSPFGLTLTVSYIKMLGIDLYLKLLSFADLPELICCDSHLHDFIYAEESCNKLFSLWKYLYRINKHKGTEFCIAFLEHIRKRGYQFCYMSEIYEESRKGL